MNPKHGSVRGLFQGCGAAGKLGSVMSAIMDNVITGWLELTF